MGEVKTVNPTEVIHYICKRDCRRCGGRGFIKRCVSRVCSKIPCPNAKIRQ